MSLREMRGTQRPFIYNYGNMRRLVRTPSWLRPKSHLNMHVKGLVSEQITMDTSQETAHLQTALEPKQLLKNRLYSPPEKSDRMRDHSDGV